MISGTIELPTGREGDGLSGGDPLSHFLHHVANANAVLQTS